MVKTRVKGNRVRLLAIKELEKTGWQVGIVERTGRFIKDKDLFSLFDLCAIRDDQIRFVQIKSGGTGGMKHKILEFSERHPVPNVSWELWVKKNRKPFKAWFFNTHSVAPYLGF